MPAYINRSGTNEPGKAKAILHQGQAVELGVVDSSFIGPLLQHICRIRASHRATMGENSKCYPRPLLGIEILKTVFGIDVGHWEYT